MRLCMFKTAVARVQTTRHSPPLVRRLAPWNVAAWLLAAVLLEVIPPVLAATLYLGPDGNDSWTGRSEKPTADRSDGPVASLKGGTRCRAPAAGGRHPR